MSIVSDILTAPLRALPEALEAYGARMELARTRLNYPKKNYSPPDTSRLKSLDPILKLVESFLPEGIPFCIAGGAVRDTLLGAKPKDYDVFVLLGKYPQKASALARKCGISSKATMASRTYTSLQKAGFSVDEVQWGFTARQRLRSVFEYYPPHVAALLANLDTNLGARLQIILYAQPSTPEELLAEFDLTFCQVAYSRAGLHQVTSPDQIYEIASGSSPIDLQCVRKPGHSFYRLLKFAAEYDCDVTSGLDKLGAGAYKVDPVTFVGGYEGYDVSTEIWKLFTLVVQENPEYEQFRGQIDGFINDLSDFESGESTYLS